MCAAKDMLVSARDQKENFKSAKELLRDGFDKCSVGSNQFKSGFFESLTDFITASFEGALNLQTWQNVSHKPVKITYQPNRPRRNTH